MRQASNGLLWNVLLRLQTGLRSLSTDANPVMRQGIA